ncbi:TPR-like protein [Dioscorea alata]|uniref:TPR-like protein n=1 Tax=Dioscorea alata TaxID=55571 RepID=A0ACB7UEB8_DIOAL|nr:TPR-like protein [Dioscorea alata]
MASHRKRSIEKTATAAAVSEPAKRRRFPSYLDAPKLPPKTRLLCEILATAPISSIERAFDDSGVRALSPDDVEAVLKLSYSHPDAAVAFFRWAGHLLPRPHQHSPYSWNLVVDLLGKSLRFEAMWDTVRSMHNQRLLSLATFASIFSSYAATDLPLDALAAFHAMPRYDLPHDPPALNSLLSALCRERLSTQARDFLSRLRSQIRPDADSYAILLEGCEYENNLSSAREVFGEMITVLGWEPSNIPAYDSFLSNLIRAPGGPDEALNFLKILRENRCFPGIKFFRTALDEFVKQRDARGALSLWDTLIGRNGCHPDTPMFNSMISLQCYHNKMDIALQLLDEMVIFGAFPDSQTYNVLLQFLLKSRKLREASVIFNEMVKNECCPSTENCHCGIRIFLDNGDWEMGVKVWKCMVTNELVPLEESANMLIAKLRELDKLPEACKYAEDMIDKGIKLNSSTLSKLKSSLLKVKKGGVYDHLLRKWKAR